MGDNSMKALNAQTEIGRRLRGCDVSLKTIASQLGWQRSVLDSYFPPSAETKPAKLPLSALWDILESGAFPADIAALLAPDGFTMLRAPESLDHDELADACRAYLDRKVQAHRADSPGGPTLTECEIADLDKLRAQIATR